MILAKIIRIKYIYIKKQVNDNTNDPVSTQLSWIKIKY